MVKWSAVVLALSLATSLAGCQPAEEGGGGGMTDRRVGMETPGHHFESAYTNLAEVHVDLVQGDWEDAASNLREVRANLDAMAKADSGVLSADAAEKIAQLQRRTSELDQLIASRNPEAVVASRNLMNTFTQESSLAQVGLEGGGAGKTQP